MIPISHDKIDFATENWAIVPEPPEYASLPFYLTPETEIDGFLVVVSEKRTYSVDLTVHEISGRYADGRLLAFTSKYLTAYIKCDGCSMVEFDPEGLHLCGVASWQEHMKLMEHVYKFAFRLMERDSEWD